MVLPMSAGSQPISIARQISLMRSPACVPTMPPPTRRWVVESNRSLVKPSSRPFARARARGAPRKNRLADLEPVRLAFFFGLTGPRHFRISERHRGDLAGIKEGSLPVRSLRRDVAFMYRFVRQHGLPSDIAD